MPDEHAKVPAPSRRPDRRAGLVSASLAGLLDLYIALHVLPLLFYTLGTSPGAHAVATVLVVGANLTLAILALFRRRATLAFCAALTTFAVHLLIGGVGGALAPAGADLGSLGYWSIIPFVAWLAAAAAWRDPPETAKDRLRDPDETLAAFD